MSVLLQSLKPVGFYLFVTLFAGIITGNYSEPHKTFSAIGFILCFFLFLLGTWRLNNKKIVITSFFLMFFLGFSVIQAKIYPSFSKNHVSHFTDSKKKLITGKIVSFAKHSSRKTKFVLKCTKIEFNQKIYDVRGKIHLSVYEKGRTSLQFGDIVQFQSKIKPIRNFNNPGGFDYKRFLKFQSVFGSAWTDNKKIKIVSSPGRYSVFDQIARKIDFHRTGYAQFVSANSKNPVNADVLISLVAGKKDQLKPEIRDLFSKAGISHLLAISGLHLSIVSLIFFSLAYRGFSFSPTLLVSGRAKKLAGLISIMPLAIYAVFTGFSPSTQRAFIMIVIVLISLAIEKEKDIISSLSFAGILILLLDASSLFSISFQLSFAAVGFIIAGLLILKKFSVSFKKKFASRFAMMMAITLSASVGTAPLTAHYFNIVSYAGMVSNLIFIPLIGFVVLPLGLVSMAFFSFLPFFSAGIIYFCCYLIGLTISFCEKIILLPFSWSRITTPELSEVTLYYSILICIFLIFLKKKKSFLFFLGIAVIGGCSQFIGEYATKEEKPGVQITVLDVGQGNSALIQTPEINILVDGGGFSTWSSFDTGRFIVAPFLWAKKITHLDYVILTHPESDHLNGLVYILDNFKVGTLIKNSDELKTKSYEKLITICNKKGIRIWQPGINEDKLILRDAHLKFIDVSKKNYFKNLNNNSLVFKLIYDEFSMLFAGDIQQNREEKLIQTENIDIQADILLSPHHGSITSSTKIFLEKVRPGSVIVSCGWNNRYGFPHKKVLKRYGEIGARVFRTDKNGAVLISSDGQTHNFLTSKGG